MIQKSMINEITTFLPPKMESLSSFEFGKLVIELNIEELKQLKVNQFQFEFLGGKSQFFSCKESKKVYEFPIMTTLWHFYQYLKDMNSITIKLQSSDFSSVVACPKKLELLPINKIMSKSYVKGNYIANSVELCDIYDQNHQEIGYMMFKVKLEFDEEIHKEILEAIDFEELLNNPEEANREKQSFVSDFGIQEKSLSISSKEINKFHNLENQENQPNSRNVLPLDNFSDTKNNEEDDIKIVEDDIDRMIAEVQNKPYDSSKYLDNNQSSSQGNFAQGSQFMNRNPNSVSFIKTDQGLPTNFQQQNIPLSQSMAYDPRINRFQEESNIRYQEELNKNQQRSRSPLVNRKYPPIPVSNNQSLSSTQNLMANTTIYSQSQRSLSPAPGRNRSLNKSQQIAYQRSMKNITMASMAGSMIRNQSAKGTLKIQIHELLGREIEINDCILRVFVNNDYEDIFNCKGSQQGEVIVYNQKVELNECQLCDIEKLRFELENWEGQILYSANFEIERLLSIPKLEGIFMLNLHPINQEFYGNEITASQTILRKIDKPPSQKSLRITVSYTEEVEVIQIYLNLSKFSLNFSKCKYKIPFTKETVEFEPTETHFNIFPHSKVYQKLMIEFWDENSIIGVSEVNLSNLKNITKNVLECNLEPVYLYDCIFPIKNIMSQNQVGKFKLLVCCGNVRQVQHILNKSMLNRTTSMKEMSNSEMNKTPIEVEYDKKLGVFIKDRKVRHEIEIQVDEKELENNQKESLETGKETDHELSMMSENEFLENSKVQELSRVHSNHLNQQQEIEGESSDEELSQQIKSSREKSEDAFVKKESMKTIESKEKPKKSSAEEKKPSPQREQRSLQEVICKNIENSFAPLKENNFASYQELKKLCKSHLLFNFIDIDIFIKYLMEMGVSKSYITEILEILQPQNGMMNFNLLNDFMMSLEVEGEVKPNLIPNKLFVKMILEEYYHQSSLEIQSQEKLSNENDEKIDEKLWLTSRYLSQISTLDESIDFNEIRKLFSELGFKISMNDYTLLKSFLENEKEIKSLLFELADSKTAYEAMIKTQTNLYEILKITIIEEILKRKKEQEMNQKYEQNILEKLYSSKFYDEKLNDSKVSENSLSSNLEESRTSNFSHQESEFKETKMNYQEMNRRLNMTLKEASQTKSSKNQDFEEFDDNDFIIANLNTKTENRKEDKEPEIKNQTKNCNKSESSDDESEKEIINMKKFKERAPETSLSKTGGIVINYSNKRTIKVEGLESCKSTYECQFDEELISPFIKIAIESPFEKKFFFKDSDELNEQSFEVSLLNSGEDEEIEGEIILCDATENGEIIIAMARFLVIKGIKSVYALKTLQEQLFSGLINVTIC